MTEPRTQLPDGLETARNHIKLCWDQPHIEHGLDRMYRTIRRRRVAATVAGSLAAAGVAAWLIVVGPLLLQGLDRVSRLPPAVSSRVDVLRFSDGSSATPLAANTRIAVGEDTPVRVSTRLERGRGRFVVTKKPARLFRVEAGDVVVTVLGTEFDIDRGDASTTVAVREGTVRVSCAGQERVLTAGERATFARPALAADLGGMPAESPPAVEPPAVHNSAPAASRRDSWQSLGEKERFDEAFAALRAIPLSQITAPDHLLLAADVARLSGHPSLAQPYLERLISRSPEDARAPLAAFSLGRLFLNELSQPAAAAQRFAQARALAPSGSMAEDALAREVEAWARAGAKDLARERAQEYLRRYPQGQRVVAVRTFGGLP